MGFTPKIGSRGWLKMESEKEDVSGINIVVDNVEMFEETIGNLKQNKGLRQCILKPKCTCCY